MPILDNEPSHVNLNGGAARPPRARPRSKAEFLRQPPVRLPVCLPSPGDDPAAVPARLREFRRWVFWRWFVRDGVAQKVPVDPYTGRMLRWQDAAVWLDFD